MRGVQIQTLPLETRSPVALRAFSFEALQRLGSPPVRPPKGSYLTSPRSPFEDANFRSFIDTKLEKPLLSPKGPTPQLDI